MVKQKTVDTLLRDEESIKFIVDIASTTDSEGVMYADLEDEGYFFLLKSLFSNLIRRSKTSLDMVLGEVHVPFLEYMANEMRESSSEIRVITSPFIAEKYLSGISEIRNINDLENELRVGYYIVADQNGFWYSPFKPQKQGERGSLYSFNNYEKLSEMLSDDFQDSWDKLD